MKKAVFLVLLVFGAWAVAITVLAHLTPSQLSCIAYEAGTSDWQLGAGFPALTSYSYGDKNWSTSPVELGVAIINNNPKPLFNVVLVVTYLTAGGEWRKVTKTNIGTLNTQEYIRTEIVLENPHLFIMNARRPTSARQADSKTTRWENVTVYVLNTVEDVRIEAYGSTGS